MFCPVDVEEMKIKARKSPVGFILNLETQILWMAICGADVGHRQES